MSGKKNKLDGFIAYLETQLKNHSIYVWGAQGQDHTVISESWIRSRETSTKNADRAIAFWKKQVDAGYEEVLRAFDCSGLGMYFLQNIAGLSARDLSSNSMLRACARLTRQTVARGDWVFRTYQTGDKAGSAYHIGYIVDEALHVIEARGRDTGVYKAAIDASGANYWTDFGRPLFFQDEIEGCAPPTPVGWTVARVLKLTSPYMRGDDVKGLQQALLAAGYALGGQGADGIFGGDTQEAVLQFQRANGLDADGKAGEDTVRALGGTWAG